MIRFPIEVKVEGSKLSPSEYKAVELPKLGELEARIECEDNCCELELEAVLRNEEDAEELRRWLGEADVAASEIDLRSRWSRWAKVIITEDGEVITLGDKELAREILKIDV